jgi:hypothetical protein
MRKLINPKGAVNHKGGKYGKKSKRALQMEAR